MKLMISHAEPGFEKACGLNRNPLTHIKEFPLPRAYNKPASHMI